MIGVFGGTFDPVHYGHLRPALELLEGIGLAQIRFIPCHVPPHRDAPQADPQQRLAMLAAAVAAVPQFVVDERELARPGPSYMVDTLASLRAELGDTPLCLLLGLDAYLGLPGWHRWRALFDWAHIVVATRPGATGAALPAPLAAEERPRRVDTAAALRRCPHGHILYWQVTPLAISATQIRGALAAGHSPRFLLPDAVLDTIEAQGLYR